MTEKFNAEIFEEWQNLVNAWDGVERELKALEAAPGNAEDSQRESALRAELKQLKAQIDALVLRMSESRDDTTEEMVVALIDTKPERKSLAEMVRERLPRSANRH